VPPPAPEPMITIAESSLRSMGAMPVVSRV
jgi:hypothetical protein